jgi:hypothetical protein
MIEAILAVLLALPSPWYADGPPETREAYEARLGTIAEAIAAEVERGAVLSKRDAAAALVSIWYGESRFALEVHAGTRHPVWTQDDGRAVCMGQLHASGLVPPHEWTGLAGTSLVATRRCAAATLRVLLAQYRRCGRDLARAFAAYGSGSSCQPTERTAARVAKYRDALSRLR